MVLRTKKLQFHKECDDGSIPEKGVDVKDMNFISNVIHEL